MEHLSNDHQDNHNQHKNSHRLCDELGHPILSLKKSQWKLRQRTWSEFLYGVKVISEEILASEEIIQKSRTVSVTVRVSK